MARSVLLPAVARRKLLDLVLAAGGDPQAAVKVARKFRTTPVTLAAWLAGLRGPFAKDRAAVLRAVGEEV